MIGHLKLLLKERLRRRGYELYRRPWLPRGTDPWEALHALWPNWQPAEIFDVGANVGSTAGELARQFPNARVRAFEPVKATFDLLARRAQSEPRIEPYQLAMGSAAGPLKIKLSPESTLNSLRTPQPGTVTNGEWEQIRVCTLDEFCAREAIRRIDLLKSDTEGHELEVLAGASRMLCAKAIDVVFAEAGLASGETRFTPLVDLQRTLEPHGMVLAGIFDQRGWSHRCAVEFCDALFVRKEILPS